ncbi:M3 family metallopeptidase [Bauldia litoralis]|uniref:Peptidyl-dipeptidase Dcp n=1 Tax=Bauldia litoralis TaxID=665467 RepID=A0A1G6AI00_9HYPH|nr:M3 family metallopeptidase [Bauldia litoralis]SDB08025.1 peptidyl-dipeptidase Dcp [Bauldia litoralis]
MTTETDNPLLAPWETPFGGPPFDRIRPEHYRPALDATMAGQRAAVDRIAADPAEPDFDNTIVALERAGMPLARVARVFFGLASANTSDALQAVEREIAPVLSRHSDEIHLNGALYERIRSVWERRDSLDLTDEQRRLVDRYHTIFERSGAALDEAGKARLAEINERLATVGTLFSQNVLADEAAWTMVLDSEDDLAGLPDWARAAAAQAAEDRDLPGKYVITLARSSVESLLQFSTRRDLREKAFEAWIRRGENGGDSDNRALIAETIRLRNERARLLGAESYAHFNLADAMARTPEAVSELLQTVWGPGTRLAAKETAELQALIAEEGNNFELSAADWRHYADRLRKRRYDFDESELKPYLHLDNLIEAAFWTASRLFGVSFAPVWDVPLYHPDVRAWEGKDRDGRALGLFLGDYFARSSKRSGAWMGAYRSQHRLDGDVRPIIVNVMNFSKPPAGKPALLSFDDARTLFHEFGHALHGLLSNVSYPLLSGTNVATDFVELPSQLFEHWLQEPEVLKRFAVHHETGEPMPDALLERLLSARAFNQGFATVEYTASALIDLDLHMAGDTDELDVVAFEKAALERIGMPPAIAMRHRTPHFLHIFSGDHYAAGYYSYLWSEVLDADAFAAFEEAGDPFDPETARKLYENVYSAGNLRDPAEAYTRFRGRMPTPEALLRKRGLDEGPRG